MVPGPSRGPRARARVATRDDRLPGTGGGNLEGVKRLAAIAGTLLILGVFAGSAAASPSGIKGYVWNDTCPGPCSPGLDPRPYGGEIKVAVRTVPDRELVTKLFTQGPDFKVLLDPGTYRIRVIPHPSGSCWQGDHKRRTIPAGTFVNASFHVYNRCVV